MVKEQFVSQLKGALQGSLIFVKTVVAIPSEMAMTQRTEIALSADDVKHFCERL